MSKLKRDVQAWAQRIKMSRYRLWAVVEGKNHDTPFYESLLTDGGGIEAIGVLQARELEIEGSSAGGKQHALKLLRSLKEAGSLSQRNSTTKIDVVFFLDRDDDEYLGQLVNDPHVVYTRNADIEADVVYYCSLPKVLSKTFSLTREEAAFVSSEKAMNQLAEKWSEWISLRLAAGECKWSDLRFSQPSKINSPIFGPVDDEKVHDVCSRIELECPNAWPPAVEKARKTVHAALESNSGAHLVKGKWLANYVINETRRKYAKEKELPAVSNAQFMSACSMGVDIQEAWRWYEAQLRPLLCE